MIDKVSSLFYVAYMHWNFAIERSRARLVAVVLELFEEIGLTGGDGLVERESRPVYRKVQRVLRSAESAVRRLIIAAAHDIVMEPSPQRPVQAERKSSGQIQIKSKAEAEGDAKPKRKRGLLFRLFDTPRRKDWGIPRGRKKSRRTEPRVYILGSNPRLPWFLRPQIPVPAPAPIPEKARAIEDGTVSALRLCRRLLATLDALEDLTRQARRFARWQGKPIEERRPQLESALRLGWPPGWRIKSTHEVDDILKDCHWLVRNIPMLDTS